MVEQKLDPPLYSRKLHMRVRRARTSCVTSLTIFAFCLFGRVWNHFARRTLPVGGVTYYMRMRIRP